ncbi:MAG TPA: hypothetical protein QF703_02225 [Candidatus Thalassarchaeaceae archaeon]|mgnify:FL=1|nr:hypothetical protein [Candidatus Thalassarchaeaceae archaeon]|tara:strand:+ start:808 stop:1287 length:480 start_codon:yes stop_codon:yes gene_type:complete
MASGPSEMILLSAGLIVAALVSGLLLETWSDMDDVLDDRGKHGMEDVRTRGSLVNDPMNISWDNANHNATLYIQNSGDTFLDKSSLGVFLNGTSMSVTAAQPSTFWLPGQIEKFTIEDPAGALIFTGSNDLMLTFSVSSDSTEYSGSHTLTKEVRVLGG